MAADPLTHVRFNHPQSGLTVTPVDAVASGTWTFHPSGADVAVTPLLRSSPLSQGRDLLSAEMFIGDVGTTFGEGVQPVEGDGVFVIGFPLGWLATPGTTLSSDTASWRESRIGYEATGTLSSLMFPRSRATAAAQSCSNRKPRPCRTRR